MDLLHDEKTGGPAFPAMEVRSADTGDLVANASQGMTLRDWFAGMAANGMLSDPNFNPPFDNTAARCYRLADAMLAERSKGGGDASQ